MSHRTWIQTIKLGKTTIVAELKRHNITHDVCENYFRLCSKLYRHNKARHQQLVETAEWQEKVLAIAEYYGLRGEVENRYAKSTVLTDSLGRRQGRVWNNSFYNKPCYDTKAMRYSQIVVNSIQEALEAISQAQEKV